MKTSESIKNLATALLQAQKNIKYAVKDSENPFFKSSYADLSQVVDTVKEPLNKAGIVILQPVVGDFVETTLVDSATGEFMTSEVRIVNSKPNDPQAQGSAITYARRYGLLSMLAVPTEDDDGEKAVTRDAAKPTYTPSPKPTAPTGTKITDKQVNMITGLVQKDLKEGGEWLSRVTTKLWKKESFVDLSMNEASALIKLLQNEIAKRANAKPKAESVKEELENLNIDEIIG